MTEVKSFVKWLVEDKHENVSVERLLASNNALQGCINEFVKVVYEKDDINIEVQSNPQDEKKTTYDVILSKKISESTYTHEGVSIDKLASLDVVDAVMSQYIYNLVVAK